MWILSSDRGKVHRDILMAEVGDTNRVLTVATRPPAILSEAPGAEVTPPTFSTDQLLFTFSQLIMETTWISELSPASK